MFQHHPNFSSKLTLFENNNDPNQEQCSGMYSKSSWGGSVDPFILAKFRKAQAPDDADPFVSIVIFEFKDRDFVGVWPSPDAAEVGLMWDHILLTRS